MFIISAAVVVAKRKCQRCEEQVSRTRSMCVGDLGCKASAGRHVLAPGGRGCFRSKKIWKKKTVICQISIAELRYPYVTK